MEARRLWADPGLLGAHERNHIRLDAIEIAYSAFSLTQGCLSVRVFVYHNNSTGATAAIEIGLGLWDSLTDEQSCY